MRFERFYRSDTSSLASRVVIKNHGPSPARQVALSRLVDTKGQGLDLDSFATSATPPIGQLLAGQEFHVIVQFSLAEGDPVQIDAEWQDRSGNRSTQFVLSPHYV